MGAAKKKKDKQRKKGSSSGDEYAIRSNVNKAPRAGGPSSDTEEQTQLKEIKTVSQILSETNCVLFNESADVSASVFDETAILDKADHEHLTPKQTMSSTADKTPTSTAKPCEVHPPITAPTISDVMNILQTLSTKMDNVEYHLHKLDTLEQKVDAFENEIKALHILVHDNRKMTDESILKIDERIDRIEFVTAEYQSRIDQLEKENEELKDHVTYMRIKEEVGEDLDTKLRSFMVEQLKLARSLVDSMKFERVHRIGAERGAQHANRKIVCKFAFFTDRELVRRQKRSLSGTEFFKHEQFPPEIVARRRKLMPQLQAAIKDNKRACWGDQYPHITQVLARDVKQRKTLADMSFQGFL